MKKRNTLRSINKITEFKNDNANYSYLYKSSSWKMASKSFLSKNPLCVHCFKKGLYIVSTETDHIKPHRGDAKLFWDVNNWQALCKRCHGIKTYGETRSANKLPIFKDFNKDINVFLVCGFQGSGRLDYVNSIKKNNDVVIDYADIAVKEFGIKRHKYETLWQKNYAINSSHDIINRLSSVNINKDSSVYIIVECPSVIDRKHYVNQLGCSVILVIKDMDSVDDEYKDIARSWLKSYTVGHGEKQINI